MWEEIVDSGLGVMCVVSGWYVVSGSSAVESVLHMVVVFVCVGVGLISLGLDYLGLMVVMVYVGAIAVLFLFVVMMLGGGDESAGKVSHMSWAEGGMLGLGLVYVVLGGHWVGVGEVRVGMSVGLSVLDGVENIEVVGEVLFSYGVWDVLVAGGVLLVGVIGAVVLVVKSSKKSKKGKSG